jgi:hypothetical protein
MTLNCRTSLKVRMPGFEKEVEISGDCDRVAGFATDIEKRIIESEARQLKGALESGFRRLGGTFAKLRIFKWLK